MVIPVTAKRLKRVAILPFINIEKSSNYNYLETTITTEVKKKLEKNFAFKTLSETLIKKVAAKNFIFHNDLHTKTAAMNIGLLAKQDIVIAGGYKIKRDAKLKKEFIETNVFICDISKKKCISEFVIKGPADNRIFTTIQSIANKITKESVEILPNKAEWKKMGYIDDSSGSFDFFTNPEIKILAGGYYNFGGYAAYFKAEQPFIQASISGDVPWIWEPLAVSFGLSYFKHSLKSGDDSKAQLFNYSINTIHLGLHLSGIVTIELSESFGFHPQLGGGFMFQFSETKGSDNENLTNGFPFILLGLPLSYKINPAIKMYLFPQIIMEIENSTFTWLTIVTAGVSYSM